MNIDNTKQAKNIHLGNNLCTCYGKENPGEMCWTHIQIASALNANSVLFETFENEISNYQFEIAQRTKERDCIERETWEAAVKIIKTFYGCTEHVYPKESCLICTGRRATLDEIIGACARAAAHGTR